MSTMLPVLVDGEALFDFIATEVGHGLGGSRTFQKRVGASPFNIAAIVATRVGAAEANPKRQEAEQILADNRVS
jgi:sugar/nucleoside kinase (ribokinase family)